MRKLVVSLALALAAAYTVEAGYRAVQLGEVIALARHGVSDQTIVSFLESRELAFVVGTDEILQLREAGAGEPLIRYLIERTSPREAPPREVRDDADYGGAYIEYGPRYDLADLARLLAPWLVYDSYYGGGLFGWLGHTFSFGHHDGRYYVNGHDHGHGYRHHDRGRSYRNDDGRAYRNDRGSYYAGRSHGRSDSYTYRTSSGRTYKITYRSSTSGRG